MGRSVQSEREILSSLSVPAPTHHSAQTLSSVYPCFYYITSGSIAPTFLCGIALEQALITHLQKFLLELGRGFSFVARQKRITFDGRHFRIDLVFYNYILKCFVLIDLKVGDLTHQDLGQMQMYVHYYERELMNEGDNPPIGIVLCADKSESVVKYTLPENETQIFASKYKLYLPSEEELLRELNQEYQALEAGKTGEENSGDMKEE